MSTFWPGCTFARSTSACQAVSATRGTEAASATDRLAGLIGGLVSGGSDRVAGYPRMRRRVLMPLLRIADRTARRMP